MTKLPPVINPRNYLAMLCQGSEQETGRDVGFVWFVQDAMRNWRTLPQGAMPEFPDPIAVRRR